MSYDEVIKIFDNKIMTFVEVAEAAGVSLSTLKREISRGTGPKVVSISTRRKGVQITDYNIWLESRTS